MDFFDALRAAREQQLRHPGAIARDRWAAVAATVDVARGNSAELRALLERAAGDMDLTFQIMRQDDDTTRQQFQRDVRRQLHNYVASNGSVVDHMRRLVKRYKTTHAAFVDEYQERVDRLIETPAASFVDDLRDFTLHRLLPPLGHRVSMSWPAADKQFFESGATIDVPTLLEWKKWRRPARSYLNEAGEQVDLLAAIKEYDELVTDLHDWLFAQFPKIHGTDVESENALRESLRAQIDRDFPGQYAAFEALVRERGGPEGPPRQ